ncbi:glutamate receptor ionotropic, NMDA 2D isoform X2 [Lepeophtheirus salmonis]
MMLLQNKGRTKTTKWIRAIISFTLMISSFPYECQGLDLPKPSSNRRGIWKTKSSKRGLQPLNLGLILPHSIYNEREYTKAVVLTFADLQRSKRGNFKFLQKVSFDPDQVHRIMMKVIPSPTEILENLCENFLKKKVAAILYLTNSELFGRSTASAQYFLQLASYLGIPVIAWNADNSGLERRASKMRLQLQLAPSLEHQVAAMLSILVRYNWKQFSVVTSEIAGHDDFIQAVRDKVAEMREHFSFKIQVEVKVTSREEMAIVKHSETRILLLYSTRAEGENIMRWAKEFDLTGNSYVWITTQSVIGEGREALPEFPAGMLGVNFDTSLEHLVKQIPTAMKVFAHGVEAYLSDPQNKVTDLVPELSCNMTTSASNELESRWSFGERFHRYLRNVTIKNSEFAKPHIDFLPDGTLKSVELKIMNLRPGVWSNLVWEEIGVWQSYKKESNGLDIKDIVWPGHSHVPPQGVPEKFDLTVGFLEEPPFINLSPPDPITGRCNVDRGVPCRIPNGSSGNATSGASIMKNDTTSQCCSGLCIDLLAKFADDLQFEYDLIRVEDPKWGILINGKWNGLMSSLVEKKFDMVLTSLKVNGERESVIDFSAPFLESGTTILVAKRTGIISPTAFLEPFDAASWVLVIFAAVQISALTIFFFEWLSPAGYDMKTSPAPDHKFSLFRTYWLVWALLFQAPVNMDCPRAFTARFMASVFALFAVVFLAIYTASLATFMITREDWDTFSGLDDTRLSNPMSVKPPIKFGTVPHTYTEQALKKHFPEMYEHMKPYNKPNVIDGVSAVKRGDLDAFVYDGTVLEYLVAQDEDCKLLTVGSWYAMTGYAAAFPRNSKHFQSFNRKIIEYSENGDLERLRRFWLTGTCNPKKEEKKASEPLAPEQFLSAFLLLLCGIALAAGLMGLEHVYINYLRGRVVKTDRAGCCALISQSMGKTLTFRGTVYEASQLMKMHRCKDPICDSNLMRVRHDLDQSRLKLRRLEKELRQRGIQPLSLLDDGTRYLKKSRNGSIFTEKIPRWLKSVLPVNTPSDSNKFKVVQNQVLMQKCRSNDELMRSKMNSSTSQGTLSSHKLDVLPEYNSTTLPSSVIPQCRADHLFSLPQKPKQKTKDKDEVVYLSPPPPIPPHRTTSKLRNADSLHDVSTTNECNNNNNKKLIQERRYVCEKVASPRNSKNSGGTNQKKPTRCKMKSTEISEIETVL